MSPKESRKASPTVISATARGSITPATATAQLRRLAVATTQPRNGALGATILAELQLFPLAPVRKVKAIQSIVDRATHLHRKQPGWLGARIGERSLELKTATGLRSGSTATTSI
jgi:hypothetical protein